MKKTSKALVTSFATIALSASMIAGSTFALFTSEAKTNIAITSGKVSVTATAAITRVYSAEWDETKKDYNEKNTYEHGTGEPAATYSFSNGGTASFSGDTLSLENITPGDGVEFEIIAENQSSVSIKYQTVVTVKEANPLYQNLEIAVDGKTIEKNLSTAVSEWTTVEKGNEIKNIPVKIALPITAKNDAMLDKEGNALSCDLLIGVYAVQANGHDETNQNVYLINKESNLNDVVSSIGEDGGTLALSEDITLDAKNPLAIPAETDVTMDVNGKTLTVTSGVVGNDEAAKDSGLTINNGSSLTLTGTEGGEGKVELNSAVNKPAISVNGKGSVLNVEGAEIHVQNTYSTSDGYMSSFPSAIVVENGGEVNLSGNTVVNIEGQNNGYGYRNPQGAKVKGDDSTLNIEETTINATNTTAFYAENGGKINFKSGEINIKGGGGCAALGLGNGAGKIVVSGGTINITGEIQGTHADPTLNNLAFAIGSTAQNCDGAEIVVNGGIFNLAPTSGTAVAIAGVGVEDNSNAYVGGNVIINLKATEKGKAYVAASQLGEPQLLIQVYAETVINGVDNERNFRMPGLMEDIGHELCGASIDFRFLDDGVDLPDQYKNM